MHHEIPRPWETDEYHKPGTHEFLNPPNHPAHLPAHAPLHHAPLHHVPAAHNGHQILHWAGQLKKHIDRFGGIEGIVTTVTKVHHLVKQVQQAAPLIQLLISGMRNGGHDTESEHPAKGHEPAKAHQPKRKRKKPAQQTKKRRSPV